MDWKILDSEYLIRRPWLTARRDRVQLPDGRIKEEYYVLEYPTWINVIAVTRDGDMVLVRQYRHGLRRTGFEIVAGVVEEGEEPLAAAKRELQEETGYGGGEWRELMVVAANPGCMNNVSHCFLATGVERISEQHLDECEDIEVHVLPREEVKAMLLRGDFIQALMVAPLQRYFFVEPTLTNQKKQGK